MKKQYAVFGLGSFGESVAIELQKLGCEVVAIDANMERVEAIANQVSYAMKADVSDPEAMQALGGRKQTLKMQILSVRLERGIWMELW